MEQIPNKNELGLIKGEISFMYRKDQEMRKRAIENNGVIESEEDNSLDSRNTDKMKEIIAKIGWPTISKVGEVISNEAWLLVQHADHDVEFQKYCLGLMKAEPAGEIYLSNLAYLEDRIAVNEGRPQIYGTQFWEHDGVYGPRPMIEPEKVDERRKSMGLDTLEEYRQRLKKIYNV